MDKAYLRDDYIEDEFNEKIVSVLFPLIENKKNDLAKDFFEKHPNTMTIVNNARETALTIAIDAGNYEMMEYLLDKVPAKTTIKGGNKFIDSRNLDGFSPLMRAVTNQDLKAVQILLKHNPDLNIEDYTYKLTAMHLAAQLDTTDILKELLSIEKNGKKVLDINKPTKRKTLTALHLASRQGNLIMVKFLIENGADVNIQAAFSKKTAAMFSAEAGKKDVYTYLMSLEQTNKELTDMKGQTAFIYAQRNVIIRDEMDRWGESKSETISDLDLKESKELPPVFISRKKTMPLNSAKEQTKS